MPGNEDSDEDFQDSLADLPPGHDAAAAPAVEANEETEVMPYVAASSLTCRRGRGNWPDAAPPSKKQIYKLMKGIRDVTVGDHGVNPKDVIDYEATKNSYNKAVEKKRPKLPAQPLHKEDTQGFSQDLYTQGSNSQILAEGERMFGAALDETYSLASGATSVTAVTSCTALTNAFLAHEEPSPYLPTIFSGFYDRIDETLTRKTVGYKSNHCYVEFDSTVCRICGILTDEDKRQYAVNLLTLRHLQTCCIFLLIEPFNNTEFETHRNKPMNSCFPFANWENADQAKRENTVRWQIASRTFSWLKDKKAKFMKLDGHGGELRARARGSGTVKNYPLDTAMSYYRFLTKIGRQSFNTGRIDFGDVLYDESDSTSTKCTAKTMNGTCIMKARKNNMCIFHSLYGDIDDLKDKCNYTHVHS